MLYDLSLKVDLLHSEVVKPFTCSRGRGFESSRDFWPASAEIYGDQPLNKSSCSQAPILCWSVESHQVHIGEAQSTMKI